MKKMQTVKQEHEQAVERRLYDDRTRLLRKLDTVGYVPDYDIRIKLSRIRAELFQKIERQRDQMREVGA